MRSLICPRFQHSGFSHKQWVPPRKFDFFHKSKIKNPGPLPDAPYLEDHKYIKILGVNINLRFVSVDIGWRFLTKTAKNAEKGFWGGRLLKKCSDRRKSRESTRSRARRIEWRLPFFDPIRRSRDIGSESEIRPILAWTTEP